MKFLECSENPYERVPREKKNLYRPLISSTRFYLVFKSARVFRYLWREYDALAIGQIAIAIEEEKISKKIHFRDTTRLETKERNYAYLFVYARLRT